MYWISSFSLLPHLKSVPSPTGALASAPSLESFPSALLPSGDAVPFASPSHWQAAQSLLLLLPLPPKLLLCLTPMYCRLHHMSETAFESTNALLVTKSKCLGWDLFLLLTFTETPTFSFLKVWFSVIFPGHSPSVLIIPSSFYFICLPSSLTPFLPHLLAPHLSIQALH